MKNTEEKKLQWIKGDKLGTVESIKDTEGTWTTFHSGNRIATNLISEFLEPLDGEPLEFDPPAPALIKAAEVYKEKVPTQEAASSPIRTLFDKQKKNDKVKLNLTFPIEVPKKAIYEIISSSFDSNEVNDELESFIKDQISEDLILNSLFESIKELISTRYKID
jgi:hypothetical protein